MIELDTPIGVLDIGSEKSKFIIFSISGSENKVQILANTIIKTEGVKKGIISDINKLSNVINELIGKAEDIIKKQIDKIYISISPLNFYFTSFCQSKFIGDHEIDEIKDLQFLVTSGINLFHSSHEEKKIIHVLNYNLRIDKKNIVENPCGLSADSLENDIAIISCNKNTYKNYQKLIKKSYLKFENFIYSPYSLIASIFYENPLADSFLVIDFGHEKISISIFVNKNFIYSTSIAIGSRYITSDISKGLNLNYDVAEKLKVDYAHCNQMKSQQNNNYLDIDDKEIKFFKKVSNDILNNITNSRTEEIINLINNEILSLNLKNITFNKIIYTGKGCRLTGFEDILKKKIKVKTLLFEKYENYLNLKEYLSDDYDICLSIISLIKNKYNPEIKILKNKKENFFDKFYTIFN